MTDPKCPFCNTPLSEHPAGRCLDGWAATLAGWEEGDCPLGGKAWSPPAGWAPISPYHSDPPECSTADYAAAMLRLEMHDRGWLAPAEVTPYGITKAYIAAKLAGKEKPDAK